MLNDRKAAILKQTTAWVGILLLLFTSAACNCAKSGKSITVLDPPVSEAGDDIVLDSIDRLDGVYGLDWMSEGELLGILPSASYESKMFLYNLQTGISIPVPISLGTSSTVQLSPDRKHAIVQYLSKVELINLQHNYLNVLPLQTGGALGSWIDEQSYITPGLTDNQRGLVIINVDGSITPLIIPEKPNIILKVFMSKERIFLLDEKRELLMYVKGRTTITRLRNDVVDFSVSPNGELLAVVVEAAPNQQLLSVMDLLNGKAEKSVAKGRLLQQLSWSPDGGKLAFAAFSLDQGMTGLYVMHTRTGRTVAVSYRQNLKSKIVWSPSGKQFMVNEDHSDGMLSKASTSIYQLK